MSVKNFKFVSPGVFINEIDNSQLPKVAPPVGPVVIGRFRRGPAFLPTRVESLSEFIRIFGEPVRGEEASDVWRSGMPTAPTYGAYAAAAWLKNGAPITVIRLLGDQHPTATGTGDATAGWIMGSTPKNDGDSGGAYGLFLMNSSSFTAGATGSVDGTLAASWYFSKGGIILSGTIGGPDNFTVSGSGVLIESSTGTAPAQLFTAQIYASGTAGQGTPTETVTFNFDRNSKYYARKVFNTNPTRTRSALVDTDTATKKEYFLGETFEQAVKDTITSTKSYGVILPLATSGGDKLGSKFKMAARGAQTGWFMAQDLRTTAASSNPALNQLVPAFDADNTNICPRLFKFHTLTAGGLAQRNYKISIEDIKYSERTDIDPYGSFSVVIRSIRDNDGAVRVVERFDNCNLNPNSANYVAKVVGDSYFEWDNTKKRLVEYGSYPNNSSILRIQMANDVDLGQADPELLPFGAQGPVKREDFRLEFSTGSINGKYTKAPFLTHTASWGDPPAGYSSDLQYLNVRRQFSDSFKWGPGDGNTGSVKITMISDTATQYQDLFFSVTASDGTIKGFVFNSDGNAPLQGAISGSGPGKEDLITVNIAASASHQIAAQLVETINSANAFSATQMTASQIPAGGDVVVIEQLVDGTGGNTPLGGIGIQSGSHIIPGGSLILITGSTVTGTFAGGSNETGTTVANTITWGGLDNGAPGQGSWLATVKFPDISLRVNDSDGNLSDPTLAYFGYSTNSGSLNTSFEMSNVDLLRSLPSDYDQFGNTVYTKRMFMFTLDDLSGSQAGAYSYASGSRASGKSITARSGSYREILDAGYDRFTVPLFGGFNALDITEAEPFNNNRALRSDATESTYAMYYSVKKAIDILADPEFVEMNLVTIPGVTNESLTQHLINSCEDRGDALAIIDPRGGYIPASEDGTKTEQQRISANHVNEVVRNMQKRALNSSYGCTYYPWVRINDDISGGSLYVPPSVAAIGTMAFSDKQKAVWFAPAGFNRGGLSRGAAGFSVTNVRSKLTSAERDDLYETNINPIASFPSEGIVVFGQKTLQVTPSALDRINVRRLMIFVKKQVSRIAANLLFDQNVETTWDRFKTQVDPFLSNIRTSFGLTDFKVVLDESTTTPELVDRNIMYAKIFLKPARAIEYIAIDFNITNTGASFDD